MVPKRTLLCALACAAVLLAAADARAQSYPVKPIRMIVPFPPGGPIDVMGRITGDRLSQGVGQTVVIENRPGAGAVIGSRAVATAEPDGYTLLFGSSGSLAVTPALYKNAGYDPVKSFAPVAAVAEGPLVLAVHPVGAGEDGRRAGRARQGQCRQAQLRLRARHAAAHRLRAVQAPDQDRRAVRALPGRGAGDHRPGRGPPRLHHRRAGRAAAAHPARQSARARGHEPEPLSPSCRTCRPWRKPAIRIS